MPHGKPDWGVDWTPRTVRGLEDLGEHAVRLGSPVLWDRRGDVIWQTHFAEGLGQMEPFGVWGVNYVTLHTGRARQGAYCALLHCNQDPIFTHGIRKYFPFPVAARIGIEFSYGATVASWEVGARIWGSSIARTVDARIRLTDVGPALGRWPMGGVAFVDFAVPRAQQIGETVNSVLKFVLDLNMEDYVRVILDGAEWLQTGNLYDSAAVPGAAYINVEISARAVGPAEVDMFIDNVILTQNEP